MSKRSREGKGEKRPTRDEEMEEEEELEEEREEELDISDDSDSEDSDLEPLTLEEDADDPDNYAEVQVEFNIEFAKESDFHGVKNFLKTLIPNPTFNSSELADIIISQGQIGQGTEEVFGFFTCINFQDHANKQCMKQIKEFIVSKAADDSEKLDRLLSSGGLGLLMVERMMNVPHQLILPVYRALFANMEASVENDKLKNKGKRPTYDFDNYLIITHYQKKATSSKHAGKKTRQGDDDTLEYSKIEDEYLAKAATLDFSYPEMRGDNTKRWTLNGVMNTLGRVLLVPANRIPVVIHDLEELLEN